MGEWLTCDAVVVQGVIERYLAGTLGDAEVEAFEAHYLACSRCQQELKLAIAIREGLSEGGRSGVGSPEEEENDS